MKGPTSLNLLHASFEERARPLYEAGVLTDAELLIVDSVAGRFGEEDPDVLVALALALRAPRRGQVGINLREAQNEIVAEEEIDVQAIQEGTSLPSYVWPRDLREWERRVLASPMVSEDGAAGEPRPFVAQRRTAEDTLVMTCRMGWQQQRLADALRGLCEGVPFLGVDDAVIEAGIERFAAQKTGIDEQAREAIRTAARRRLTVVTGGPGTGKTFQIKRLLALLLQAYPPGSKRPLRIELAAPTGKAAVRMGEAMGEGLDAVQEATTLEVGEALRRLRAKTLHKLLGMRPDGTSRHHREGPLAADVIVVDEVSMADLVLMRRLVEAVPDGVRLVLLGDRDQLASVEAGSVLADIVRGTLDGLGAGALAGSVVRFDRSYRFERAPTVATVVQCLQRRDDERVERACRLMTRGEVLPEDSGGVTYHGAPQEGRPTRAQLDALAAPYLSEEGYAGKLAVWLRQDGPQGKRLQSPEVHVELLDALDRYRILAVHRKGPLGVSGLEREIGWRMRGLLEAAASSRNPLAQLPMRSGFWLGQPLLVTENAYDISLMNGDIGLVLPTVEGLAAVFPVVREGERTTRVVALARLPAHQGALAMTVHKSQGSQFTRLALVLAGRSSPIQTREIVYTGVTRSSRYLDLLGDAKELEQALRQRVRRLSGLSELLVE